MIKSWIASFPKPDKEERLGDCQVFFDTENKICLVIDGGCGAQVTRLVAYLKKNGYNKVYLLLTHPHYDHGHGLRKIIQDSYFTVVEFFCYDPDTLKGGLRDNDGSDSVREDIDYLKKIINEAKDSGAKVTYLKNGNKIELGDIKFIVYRKQPTVVEDDDNNGWAYINDGSLCLYFYELYYWTSGDGPMSISEVCKDNNVKPVFFKIPHHGNNCNRTDCNGLKSIGAKICWYNDLEPNGIGTNDFTAYGARRCKEAGFTVITCIGSDIEISFAAGEAVITKGTSRWTYNIPYSANYTEEWIKDSIGWWYRYADGTWAVGWKKIKWNGADRWFYFNSSGYMVTGWQYLKWSGGKNWFYFNIEGDMLIGWQYLKWAKGQSWFYFDSNSGAMVTGWNRLYWAKGIDTFYFDKTYGNMLTGWQFLEKDNKSNWYHFDKNNGKMNTNWIYDNNDWYYLDPETGIMKTGWLDYKDKKCYLEPISGRNQGHAYRNITVLINGETWHFDNNCYGTQVEKGAFVERKVIDISQFNSVTDWSMVKNAGYPVIIRIGYRGSKTGVITYDPKYKEYRKACEDYDIEHSFYFFPCSINDDEAHEEALFIKNEVLNSGILMPVFLDSEVVQRDKSGRSDTLSKERRTRYLKIICEDLLKFGIPCGIYASRSWLYNNIDMSQIPTNAVLNTWVAEYGVDKTKYGDYYAMWQYSSKESVKGINGNVDMSIQYKEFYMGENTSDNTQTSSTTETPKKEEKKVEKSELEKIIEVAKAEIGYLEKASNSNLDSKTGNAGSNNYTKYWRDINEWCGKNYQGQPYCAGFVTWCFTKALGKTRATQLLKHYPYVYCPTLGNLFTKHSNPEVGDIVIFYRNGVFAHTGLVIGVNGDQFTTIEGNTSGASAIIDNGGGVCQKSYYNSKLAGTKFCRPEYSSTTITDDNNKVVISDDIHTVKWKGVIVSGGSNVAVRIQPILSAKECSFSPLKNGVEVGVCHEDGEWYLVKYDGKYGYVNKAYVGKANTSSNSSTSTDDMHTVKWQGVVATNGDTLAVRLQPSVNANTCSFSPLKNGTEVGVCHQKGDWYLIKYNGKYGYVYASYIEKK